MRAALHRDQRGFGAFERLVKDARYAWRGLRRTPGFTAVAIITLALGIGANTVFFGLVNAVVFRPTAIANLNRVYALTLRDATPASKAVELGYADAQALDDRRPASVAAVTSVSGSRRSSPALIQIAGRADHVLVEQVSSGYAAVFGLHAQAGRWFVRDDDLDRGADVVVIGDRLWRQWFRADPGIVGQASLTFRERRYRVIGVAPAGFRGTQTGLAPTEMWYPLGRPSVPASPSPLPQYMSRPAGVPVFVRIAPGFSPAQITGDLRAILRSQPDPDPAAETLELQPGQEALRVTELVALAAGILSFAGLVFLAACANLANMLHARGTERAGEIAVRLSLGASALSIFQLFMAEAAIIALSAAAIGLTMALCATAAFAAAFPTFRLASNLGVTLDLSPDYRVFVFAFGAGTLAALIVGLLTAWRSSRVSVIRAIGATATTNIVSSRRRGLPLTFVSVQISAAVLLLVGAGLFLENTHAVLDRRIHYDTSKLVAARILLRQDPQRASDVLPVFMTPEFRALSANERGRLVGEWRAAADAHREKFFADVVSRVRALPGVEAAATTDALPGGTAPAPSHAGGILQAVVVPDGATGPARRLDGSWIYVSPELLDTLGLKLLRGRNIQPLDARGAPLVALVSQSTAEGLWPGEDPIGKTITCCKLLATPITVVGVAADPASSSDRSPLTRHSNFVYLAAAQRGGDERFIVARAANPGGQVDAIRAVIHGLNEHAPVFDAGPVDQFLLAGVAIERAQRVLTMSLGLIALGIAVLGVYAVVGYFVSRRTREFGLRLALGALPRQILKMVVDYAVHIILIGLLPGVLLASLGTRLFEQQLFGIMPNGITMWVVAPMLMLAAGVVAGLVPARRAARVDPNVTLREL